MSSLKGQNLSDYLKSMVRAGMLRQDMAEELNQLSTKEQQRQAYRLLPDACLEAARGVVRNIQLENAPSPQSDDVPVVTTPDAARAKSQLAALTLRRNILGTLFWMAALGFFFRGSLHRMFDHLMDISRPPAVPPPAMATPVTPSPQLIDAIYVSGHRVRIRWTPLGDDYGYGVYAADASGKTQGLIGIVATPGAIVDVAAQGMKEAFVVVTAVRQEWAGESLPSPPVTIKTDSRNNRYSLEPLPR